MKTFSNHSKFITSVTSDLELKNIKLVINIASATPAALWRFPRRVSSKKCRKHRHDTFLRKAPQRARFHADNIGDQLVFCQFEVVCHAGHKFGEI